jgi:hypothetical protein
MNKLTQAALLAFALSLSAGTVAHVTPAKADVAVTFDTGSVAFGYNDGYWDRAHAWHAWPNVNAASDYRTHYTEHYYDRRHDELPGGGWREEHWWH